MKLNLTPLLCIAAFFPCLAVAADDWQKEAREFMAAQNFAPIEIKPGTRFESDEGRERWGWMQRVILPPFEKHLEKWPAQAAAARSFVRQALMVHAGHPDVDPKRPWEAMAKEGVALINAKVDEPLVYWFAGWAVWQDREAYSDARDYLSKAKRHKLLKDYPAVVASNILKEDKDIMRRPPADVTSKIDLERFKHMLKCATDTNVYRPQDDELLFKDLEFVFSSTNVKEHADELEKLCNTPQFTPWLREMLQGDLEHKIAWTYRGTGYANTVKAEGWKQFEEHQIKARDHYLKAWELRPGRAAPASKMVEIVKCGNGRQGDTLRLWFDRAIGAQFDYYPAYYNLLWALRPRWGGSVEQMKAFYCACALTGHHETAITSIMHRTLDYLKEDTEDLRAVLSQPPMKKTVVAASRAQAESDYVYRGWQRPWRLADLGVMAWAVGDYETAYDTFQKVPEPFPRQTRRRLLLMANEAEVRGQSALYAFGFNNEWDAAEEMYMLRKVSDALQGYQDIAARFQGEPPGVLMERIAACKFEKALATGEWVPIQALPDMAEWHRLSGSWSGTKEGTLINNGIDAQAFMLHNGRTGSNFELMGEYEVKDIPKAQGLCIILGYHSQPRAQTEDWISCAQWSDSNLIAVSSMLRKFYTTPAPRVTPPINGQVYKFHIVCRNGAVTYRLNHRDIVVGHRVAYEGSDPFEMPEDSVIGFFNHFFDEKSHTHIRHIKIRSLDPPEEIDKEDTTPASLTALRSGFDAERLRTIADLNERALVEAETLAKQLQQAGRAGESEKTAAFGVQLKRGEGIKLEDMPVPAEDEESLATLLRGYRASLSARLATARDAWKTKALKLQANAQDPQEAKEVTLYVEAELEAPRNNSPEEPLAASNQIKWQRIAGEWTRTAEQLIGGGDSTMYYEFNRTPPFQIDFDIKVLEGLRPRLVMGNVKFANEAYKTTFGLYPQVKGEKLFTYERNKPYHITVKALAEKTELFVDGEKICDGPKIDREVSTLQFRGGDWWSKGKTEFHKIRISPLP
ncbi:hypothetical protein [Prosthecobacter sp.]|uniref:hypothetical protein n=1 Tax=Prosthecobacter sp. TaxID=1965333 RepID=UPI001DD6D082|nr:hypothetical protein [Prosthecobacter sp.]MCB1275891.1 hypothetical protein [Prosthecobacter sp.]